MENNTTITEPEKPPQLTITYRGGKGTVTATIGECSAFREYFSNVFNGTNVEEMKREAITEVQAMARQAMRKTQGTVAEPVCISQSA